MQYVRSRWPLFFFLYGLLIFSTLLIGISLAADWFSFIPFSIVIMLIASYLLIASLFVAYRISGGPGGTSAEFLFEMSQASPKAHIVCIDLGLRSTAVTIAQRLTTGSVMVIDLYNPQSNIGGSLRRRRELATKPPDDPRLEWIDGRIELLPVPDRHVSVVIMDQILSEFWLPEERNRLLQEVFRILEPEGRLLIAERTPARTNTLLTGPATTNLPSGAIWRAELENSGFVVQREEYLRGLLYCVRADRPGLTVGKQLIMDFKYY